MERDKYDPVRFRAELTADRIVDHLVCFLPNTTDTMPTTICLEEAIARLPQLERELADARAALRAAPPAMGLHAWREMYADAIRAAIAAARAEGQA